MMSPKGARRESAPTPPAPCGLCLYGLWGRREPSRVKEPPPRPPPRYVRSRPLESLSEKPYLFTTIHSIYLLS